MDKKNQNLLTHFLSFCKISAVAFPLLGAIIAISFFFAMKNDYDIMIGHFSEGSAVFAVTVIGSVLAVILGAVGVFLSKKSASLVSDPAENPVTVFGAVFCAVLSFVFMVVLAFDYMRGLLGTFKTLYTFLIPFLGVSMILSLSEKLRFSFIRKISAIAAVVAVNVSMFADYFDFTLPLNSPIRNFVTVIKAAALLYLLSEARFAFGAKSGRLTLPATFLATGVTAAVTLGYSVGAVLTELFAELSSNPNPSMYEVALYAAIGIHALGRFISLIPCVGEYVPPVDKNKEKSTTDNSEEKPDAEEKAI